MQIKNDFEVPLPPPSAWSLLMNVPLTAACFPGAELVDTIDEDHYKGRVTVKLGPVTMIFAGNLQIENRDDARHAAAVKATWTETKGRGNAVTLTRFTMQASGSGTRVNVDSDIQLAGQVAQYGRGAGMIAGLSAQLIAKFADNLRAQIQAAPPAPGETRTPHEIPPAQTEISVLALLWQAFVARLKRILA